MKIIPVSLNNPDQKVIQEASQIISQGGVVIHPTDTAYGIAANPANDAAIKRVYRIKGRDFTKPLILAVKDLEMAKTLGQFNSEAQLLFKSFLPGPLTLVVPKSPRVSALVSGGQPTVAIRLPKCSVTMNLSSTLDRPYTTTSANPSGQANPYSIEQIIKSFGADALSLVDLILDAGELPMTPPSTIVDVTSPVPKLLRVGPISEEQIKHVLSV